MPDLSQHPLNLALRFTLEMTALAAYGYWGWRLTDGPWRIVAAVGIPLLLALAWGLLGVVGDTRGQGRAPIPVPGRVRLLLELGILLGAGPTLVAAGRPGLGWPLLAVTLVQTLLLSYGRVLWLLRR